MSCPKGNPLKKDRYQVTDLSGFFIVERRLKFAAYKVGLRTQPSVGRCDLEALATYQRITIVSRLGDSGWNTAQIGGEVSTNSTNG